MTVTKWRTAAPVNATAVAADASAKSARCYPGCAFMAHPSPEVTFEVSSAAGGMSCGLHTLCLSELSVHVIHHKSLLSAAVQWWAACQQMFLSS